MITAGETIPQFHFHIIPRYAGDVPAPRVAASAMSFPPRHGIGDLQVHLNLIETMVFPGARSSSHTSICFGNFLTNAFKVGHP